MTGFPSTPLAPPTAPDPNAIARSTPVWPMVIGILSVVFGAGGLMLAGVGIIVWIAFSSAGFPNMAGEGYRLPMIAMQAVYLLLAALLLAGGILLLMKRRKAVTLLVAWSWSKIVYGIVYSVVNGLMQQAMLVQMQQAPPPGGNPAQTAAFQTGFSLGMLVFTFVFTLAWYAAMPVFLLVWFRRTKVKLDVAEHFDRAPGPTAP